MGREQIAAGPVAGAIPEKVIGSVVLDGGLYDYGAAVSPQPNFTDDSDRSGPKQNLDPNHLHDDPSVYFNDYSFEGHDNLSGEKIKELQHKLGLLAAELWNLPNATWQDLADKGGYAGYLKEIENICSVNCEEKFGGTIEAGEERIRTFANRHGLDTVWVSGVTGVRKAGDRITEVLLSKTDPNKKPWSHQPHGGGRMVGEGPVAAMLREFGEEAGWGAASALLNAFRTKDAYYAGYYASRIGDVLGEDSKNANTLLAIQCFIIEGDALKGVDLQPRSDSKAAEWLRLGDLNDAVFTTQLDHWLRTIGADIPTSKYTHPLRNEGYDGTL